MRTQTIQALRRQDYTPFPFQLSHVHLEFDLAADATRVASTLHFKPTGHGIHTALRLNGVALELLEVMVDGRPLTANEYELDEDILQLSPPSHGEAFIVRIISVCHPARNTTLMGLYESEGKLFTQCEAEGFRRITWFPDRPDVMAQYDVVLRASPDLYPILLSNGNLLEDTMLDDGRRQVVWHDPHPKPSYLFALVAGDFDCLEKYTTTQSGRQVLLQVYSDRGFREQTHWALDCLERALRWDETRFGLELDLDRFMVVAARDFNMGAMENKGLNIFNAAYVLADPTTATDAAYHGIESVIGHEYFHNWTGNRVTCRDWFQLSLKEGLTVFREQEFAADMLARGLPESEAASARAVKRIDDVHTLRLAQFPEDAGPMAHPIRPDAYTEIANFYTATIYEKGAEVIRMLHTLLGEEGFRAGMDEYFKRYDGQAVTCDDFVDAMESVYQRQNPGKNLSAFRRWYEQAGTPRIQVSLTHDPQERCATLTLRQHCSPVGLEAQAPSPAIKPPLHIPVAIGMLDQQGRPLPVSHQGSTGDSLVLELQDVEQRWTFANVAERPVLSLLRGFSAPVIVESERNHHELALLASHDSDAFARWDAIQELTHQYLQAAIHGQGTSQHSQQLIEVWKTGLQDSHISAAYKARLLTLPAIREVIARSHPMNPQAASRHWHTLHRTLGQALAPAWAALYDKLADDGTPYSPDATASGKRALRNLALAFMVAGQQQGAIELAATQYRDARNMTDRFGALMTLVHLAPECAKAALGDFYGRWRDDPLVLDRWFSVQASAPSYRVADVRTLMTMPEFSLRNPNRARAVVFRFCFDNPAGLHTPEGYEFWVEQVLALDALNPEIAARLSRAFDLWAQHEPVARQGMHKALQRVMAAPHLSRNVQEIVSRALNA